ncbi:MAG: c-type cytochrome [Verrucomicrobiales bacterium]|nr:c-type cytochrome [Verrucomicrobiales bacterium]
MNFRYLFAALLILSTTVGADDFPVPYNTEKEDTPPMSAEEAAKTATLPDGFRLEVFAAEPLVQQPISIAFDQKDRLWVSECYTFAERPLRWDLELQDRIIVLQDKDSDGKADTKTVFWDKAKRLTSAIPGKGGVWALCSPELLFIPDADNDLVPDSEPVVMLDGFDDEHIGHNIVNGLKWGPDGWLYGRHGITRTSLVGAPGTPPARRTALNCAIWCFHPETRQFEVFCHGGTNPWGLDWDKNGQLFYTNTVIGHLWHAIPGAYYTRMFGAHLNPHVYELIPHTADHYHWDTGAEKWNDIRSGVTNSTSSLGGGHAHMGCLIYQGGVWPEEYHGNLYTCNLHGRRINRDILNRKGVGYVATHGEDFLMMKDPWFRGLDLITGPDGQVWMNDWSDTGECHDNDGIHRTSGRIYRIVYDGPDKGKINRDAPAWLSTSTPEEIEALLTSDDEAKIAIGVRRLSEYAPDDQTTFSRLQTIATQSPPGLVRLELAAALQRLPEKERFALADLLCRNGDDADDRQQPLMIWYGIEKSVPNHPELAINLALSSEIPKVTSLIARRITSDIESNPAALNQLLTKATKEKANTVLKGVAAGLKGWSKATMPTAWETFAAKITGPENKETVRDLSLLFGDGRAREELITIAKNQEADPGARKAALKNLLRQPDETLFPLLKNWTTDKVLSTEAIRGLAAYDEPGISGRVMNFWRHYPLSRNIAMETLVARPRYAAELLTAIEKGKFPRQAIAPLHARQIVNLGDESLQKQLTRVWGEIRETPEEKKQEIAKWHQILTQESIAASDPVKGKMIFSQVCGACHRLYGEGGLVGPDLTGSDRHSLDYLLENTINPNDVVPVDYQLTVFTMNDGRVVSGVVPEESEKTVTVQATTEKITLNKSEIKTRQTLPNSLMPEGLLKAMDPESVKDLIAYLMTTQPVRQEP